jgi:hypothetical protein
MYKLPRCSGKTIRRRRTSKGYATCNVIATIGEEMGRKVVDQGTSTIHQLQGLELTSRPATALNIFFVVKLSPWLSDTGGNDTVTACLRRKSVQDACWMGLSSGRPFVPNYPAGHDGGVEIQQTALSISPRLASGDDDSVGLLGQLD